MWAWSRKGNAGALPDSLDRAIDGIRETLGDNALKVGVDHGPVQRPPVADCSNCCRRLGSEKTRAGPLMRNSGLSKRHWHADVAGDRVR